MAVIISLQKTELLVLMDSPQSLQVDSLALPWTLLVIPDLIISHLQNSGDYVYIRK